MREEWDIKRLGDVATLQRGFDLPIQDRIQGVVPIISSSGPSDTHHEAAVEGPGVVTGRSGSIGSVFFVEEDFWPLNTSLFVKDFGGNDPRFVYYLLIYLDLSRFASGAGVPTLNRNHVHDELVAVPPLPEQQRIVTLLDEAFAGLATVKANTERNLQNARAAFERQLQSVINACGEGWVETTLESCCEQIFAGGDVPKDRLSKVRTSKFCVPIFSNGEKDDGLYGFTDEARVTRPSITVSARGTLGFSTIRTEPFLPVVRLIVLVPDSEQISLAFLYYASKAMDFGNTGTSIPQLTVPNIKESKLLLPPLTEQNVIAQNLDSLKEETQHLTHLYERKLAALEELKKSLLQQAFNGEL